MSEEEPVKPNVVDLIKYRRRKAREQDLDCDCDPHAPEPLVVIFVNGERRGAKRGPIPRSELIELMNWEAKGFEKDYYVAHVPLGCWDYREIKIGEEVNVFPLMQFHVSPK